MARFPYRPGAGAKAIRNPIYWNRLYLQERSSVRRESPKKQMKSRGGARVDAKFRAMLRFMSVNASLNLFLCAWLYPLTNYTEGLTESETDRLSDALNATLSMRGEMYDSLDGLNQRELQKFVTRVKRLFKVVLGLVGTYWEKSDDVPTAHFYDKSTQEYILEYKGKKAVRKYFLGQPDSSESDRVNELFTKSSEMISEWAERIAEGA